MSILSTIGNALLPGSPFGTPVDYSHTVNLGATDPNYLRNYLGTQANAPLNSRQSLAASLYGNKAGISAQEINAALGLPDSPSGSGGTQQSGSGGGYSAVGPNIDVNAQKNSIYSSANDAATNQGIGLRNNILDFISGLQSKQGQIDVANQNNELAKIQGSRSILDMVGRGIKSGGVQLANRNAGTSSATQGIANAYGQIGRQQMSQVGNQYAQEQNTIGQEQNQLNTDTNNYVRNFQGSKDQIINQIVSTASQALSTLDAQIANANLPQRIAIEQEKQNIRAQALAHLGDLDQVLSQGVSSVKPQSQQDNQVKALQLANAGQVSPTAFNYSTEAPVQFQGTGPFSSSLPIFTFPGNKKQTA